MYKSYKKVLHDALENHDREELIAYKDQFNRGFETSIKIEHDEKTYDFRMIILYDQKVAARKRNTLHSRVAKTLMMFEEVEGKFNRYKLNTKAAIEKRCDAVLKRYHTTDFLQYTVNNTPVTTYKNKGKGKPAKGETPEQVAVVTGIFSISLDFNQAEFEIELALCGREFTGEDILLIQEVVDTCGGISRLSSPAWRMRARDEWIDWTDEQRKAALQQVVNNSRREHGNKRRQILFSGALTPDSHTAESEGKHILKKTTSKYR